MKQQIKKLFSDLGYELSFHKKRVPVETRSRFESYKTSFLSNTIHVHDYASFEHGIYELFQGEIYKFNSPTDTPYIIDCGANLGMSVIYFKTLYPNAEIVAFEADPYIYKFLQDNIKSFNFQKVIAINKAVWVEDNLKFSFLSEGGAGGRMEEMSDHGNYIEVETIKLKNYLNREVDFLKIDIEGAESNVIKDCAEELKNVKTMFIEYHSFPDSDQKLHSILEIVQQAGFRYHIKEAFTSKRPFEGIELNVGMDLQLNIFCFRN